MIWYNKFWFQIMQLWFDLLNSISNHEFMIWYSKSWFQIMTYWFEIIAQSLAIWCPADDGKIKQFQSQALSS